MFSRIRVKAAETVVRLLKQGFFSTYPPKLQARSFVNDATVSAKWIFAETVMDRDGDGRITIDEIETMMTRTWTVH